MQENPVQGEGVEGVDMRGPRGLRVVVEERENGNDQGEVVVNLPADRLTVADADWLRTSLARAIRHCEAPALDQTEPCISIECPSMGVAVDVVRIDDHGDGIPEVAARIWLDRLNLLHPEEVAWLARALAGICRSHGWLEHPTWMPPQAHFWKKSLVDLGPATLDAQR